MNLRIVEQVKRTILAEIYDVDIVEIPEKDTSIYVNGEAQYVRQVIKSYEPFGRRYSDDLKISSTWFVVEV